MKLKTLLLSVFVAGSIALSAQTTYDYDVTDVYLVNPGFDENLAFNHVGDSIYLTGTATIFWDSDPWELRLSGNIPIHAFTFNWGVPMSVNGGLNMPPENSDGNIEGGALLLDVGAKVSRAYGQRTMFPPGDYMLVTTARNLTSTTSLTNRSGWFSLTASKSSSKQSSLRQYPTDEWVNDTIKFTVKETVEGYIQVGYGATTVISSVRPILIYDGVKVFRTTPVDETDVQIRKEALLLSIENAETLYGEGNGQGAEDLKTVIDNARVVYENADATIAEINQAIADLKSAINQYSWNNNGIEVTIDKRFARGATMAFARMSYEGDNNGIILGAGVCLSENPEPTVLDKLYYGVLSNNGNIYYFRNLKPQTKYYMRAYIMDKSRNVKYSDAIKFYTIPMGSVTYWYNNGGDDAANARINAAATEACSIFSNLSSAKKHFGIGYSSGTPTADCYYADEPWMNMGANSSYQRTGTIMHEMEHGLGVIPYDTQWNKNILREGLDGSGRGTGHWLGDRVSAFLDFWDNTTGSQLNGDYQHMWPYGINGASEDHGSLVDYYANAMICQALGEDGLEHNSYTMAERYYAFEQEDDVKYYIKNENEARGLYTSYLYEAPGKVLRIREMSAREAAENDSCAWYVTFEPVAHLYLFRNAATGHYITYNGSRYIMAERTSPVTADHMQLMRGRVDVTDYKFRGYWIFNPTSNWTPNAFYASSTTATGATTFNLRNTATVQRWLILTDEEMRAINTTTDGIRIVADETEGNGVCGGVYDLQGRRLQTGGAEVETLPRGIYIVGGKKVIVK